MVKLIALWTPPADAEGFHADYLATHAELCRALPGVDFWSGTATGQYVRMASLGFADAEAMGAALSSPAGAPLMEDTKRLRETFGNDVTTLVVTEG